MNRKINNIVSIVGLICIIALVIAPVNTFRVAQDMALYCSDAVIAHFSDCHAPGGINDQIAERGIVDVVINKVQPFENGKGHYANNNRHIYNNHYAQNNDNNQAYQQSKASNQIDIPDWLRYILMGGLIWFLFKWMQKNLGG